MRRANGQTYRAMLEACFTASMKKDKVIVFVSYRGDKAESRRVMQLVFAMMMAGGMGTDNVIINRSNYSIYFKHTNSRILFKTKTEVENPDWARGYKKNELEIIRD